MNEALDTISAKDWLNEGGIAFNGSVYLSPKSARPWGEPGCPFVPRHFRQNFGDMKLPPKLGHELGAPHVYLSELDSEAYRRFNIGDNSQRIITAILGMGYNITYFGAEVAIPSGIPLDWLLGLPVKSRALNGIRRMYGSRDWRFFSKEPVLCSEILSIYGLGIASLLELLCVIESAECEEAKSGNSDFGESKSLGSEEISMTRSQFQFLERNIAASASERAVSKLSGSMVHLQNFVDWAVTETKAATFSDAFELAMSETILPEEVMEFLQFELKDVSDTQEHPYESIENWLKTLSDRERVVFLHRLFSSSGNRLTLDEIGSRFNVSRERIRQVAKKLSVKFEEFLKSSLARPIRWRCEHIRSRIGVASPKEEVEHLLAAPNGVTDLRAVLLNEAGYDYDTEGDWLISKAARYDDPLADVGSMANEHGLINVEVLADELRGWGLARRHHESWILRDGRVSKMPSGRFYMSGTGIADRMVANLSDIGHAVSVGTLMEYRNEDRSVYSVRNAIASDSRIVRVSRSKWGLRDWDSPEYESVATAIRDLLTQEGSSMQIDEISSRLRKDFNVAENTVRTYCSTAPMFICEGVSVRLRNSNEPFVYEEGLLGDKSGSGVFRLGHRKLSLLLEVDGDMERGSGRRLSMAAGALLDLQPRQELVFFDSIGNGIRLNFPESSLIGPQLGSLRSVLKSVRARKGELLTLILNSFDLSFSACTTDVSQHERGWDLIARLTGVEAESGLGGLAKALGCNNNSVRAVLTRRGDRVVRDALPDSSTSPDLEEALSTLEGQLSIIQNQG